MVKDPGSKFDDYSISVKIRQISLYWGYELTEKDFVNDLTNQCIKMSYYQCTDQKSCKKQKEDTLKKKLLSIIYKTKKR